VVIHSLNEQGQEQGASLGVTECNTHGRGVSGDIHLLILSDKGDCKVLKSSTSSAEIQLG